MRVVLRPSVVLLAAARPRRISVVLGIVILATLVLPGSTGAASLDEIKNLTATAAAQAVADFGSSVAVSGDTAVVGALFEDAGIYRATAYVFQRDQGGADNWGEVARLIDSDAAKAEDLFGYSVALSDDTAVVGACCEETGSAGAAYVFQRNEGGPDNWGEVKKLTASEPQAEDSFGDSVAVSGDTAFVVARTEDAGGNFAGTVYIFQRNEGGADNWGRVKKLTASDAQLANSFGDNVAVSGDAAVVGARYEDAGGNFFAGAAYVFQPNDGGADDWGEAEKLTASDAQDFNHFGSSVAVSGDTAVVGACCVDYVDSPDPDDGAYVFQRDWGGEGNWGQVKKLTASDAEADNAFGTSVAVSGDTTIVGASWDDAGGIRAGGAYVFQRDQGGADNWGEVKKLTASDAEANDYFGSSVAVSANTAVVGAHSASAGANFAGAAYVFLRNEGGADNWGEVKKLTASDAEAGDSFGWGVAVAAGIAGAVSILVLGGAAWYVRRQRA